MLICAVLDALADPGEGAFVDASRPPDHGNVLRIDLICGLTCAPIVVPTDVKIGKILRAEVASIAIAGDAGAFFRHRALDVEMGTVRFEGVGIRCGRLCLPLPLARGKIAPRGDQTDGDEPRRADLSEKIFDHSAIIAYPRRFCKIFLFCGGDWRKFAEIFRRNEKKRRKSVAICAGIV